MNITFAQVSQICCIAIAGFTLVISTIAIMRTENVSPEFHHSHHVDESDVPQSLLDEYPDAMGNMHVHILKDDTKEIHFNGHPALNHHK